jgi:hypothetical protein
MPRGQPQQGRRRRQRKAGRPQHGWVYSNGEQLPGRFRRWVPPRPSSPPPPSSPGRPGGSSPTPSSPSARRRIGIDRDNDALDPTIPLSAPAADLAIFPARSEPDINGDPLINSHSSTLTRFFAGTADFNGDGLSNSQDYSTSRPPSSRAAHPSEPVHNPTDRDAPPEPGPSRFRAAG